MRLNLTAVLHASGPMARSIIAILASVHIQFCKKCMPSTFLLKIGINTSFLTDLRAICYKVLVKNKFLGILISTDIHKCMIAAPLQGKARCSLDCAVSCLPISGTDCLQEPTVAQ